MVLTYYMRGAASALFVLALVCGLICIRERLEIRGRKLAPLVGAIAFAVIFYISTLINNYYPLHGLFGAIGLPSLLTQEGSALWGACVGLHFSLAFVVVFGYRVYLWSPWMPFSKLLLR